MNTIPGPHRRTAAFAALAAAVLVLLTSCADPSEEDLMDTRQIALADRADLEQTLARYEQMQTEIRDRLDAELGPFPWTVRPIGDETGCGNNFPDTNGRVVFMSHWGFAAEIPDADWPRAHQIITEITAGYGFHTPTLQIDRPGYHKASGADLTLGAQYDFTASLGTVMQVTTGCHLRAAGRPPA